MERQNMNLDQDGLPMRKDGDKSDQLKHTAMIAIAEKLSHNALLPVSPAYAIMNFHQVKNKPGTYSRYRNDNPRNTNADTLVVVFAAFLVHDVKRQLGNFMRALLKRGGFAQNNLKVVDGVEKWKRPDFLLIRLLPLLVRTSKWLSPLAYLFDFLLVLQVMKNLFPFKRNGILPRLKVEDDLDDNTLIAVLTAAAVKYPTAISRFATRLFANGRRQNLGCRGYHVAKSKMIEDMHHPVIGALRWHHRGGTGGNPQIADLWSPVITKYILEVNQ